jgi:hypothetical protein
MWRRILSIVSQLISEGSWNKQLKKWKRNSLRRDLMKNMKEIRRRRQEDKLRMRKKLKKKNKKVWLINNWENIRKIRKRN